MRLKILLLAAALLCVAAVATAYRVHPPQVVVTPDGARPQVVVDDDGLRFPIIMWMPGGVIVV